MSFNKGLSRAMCVRCRVRYSQGQGHCRRCQRELGLDTRSTFERERDRLEAQRGEELTTLRLLFPDDQVGDSPTPRPALRTIVVNGVAYEVMWDGSVGRYPH